MSLRRRFRPAQRPVSPLWGAQRAEPGPIWAERPAGAAPLPDHRVAGDALEITQPADIISWQRARRVWERAQEQTGFRQACLVGTSFLWGLVTVFSQASEDGATAIQGASLALAFVMSLLWLGAPVLLGWIRTLHGFLLTLHVAVACYSGLAADSEMGSMLRYMALVPAFSILLALPVAGEQTVRSFRLGLTLASLAFVAFHLLHLDLGALTHPTYRLSIFMNPNSVGFISAMAGVSALSFALEASAPKRVRLAWALCVALCVVLWLGTKSRTALLAFLFGLFAIGALHARERRVRWLMSLILLAGLVLTVKARGFFLDTLSLEDRYRSVATATGRFGVWEYVLVDLWPTGPWLGVGPGLHQERVYYATGSSSAHNGFLMALVETGALGTAPLLALLALCTVAAIRLRHDLSMSWASALFVTGFTESMGEILFFSIGNPGSLLFMLAVASLAVRPAGQSGQVSFSFRRRRLFPQSWKDGLA